MQGKRNWKPVGWKQNWIAKSRLYVSNNKRTQQWFKLFDLYARGTPLKRELSDIKVLWG